MKAYHLPPEINLHLAYIPQEDSTTTTQFPILRKTIHMQMQQFATDNIQGNTGANCSATNNNFLWNYKPLLKPILIVTYQGADNSITNTFKAISTGTIK
jgi:hypothetical protein